jgi:hypothetical protein
VWDEMDGEISVHEMISACKLVAENSKTNRWFGNIYKYIHFKYIHFKFRIHCQIIVTHPQAFFHDF